MNTGLSEGAHPRHSTYSPCSWITDSKARKTENAEAFSVLA